MGKTPNVNKAEDAEAYFEDQKNIFSGLLRHSLLVSNKVGRQQADERRVMASWLFMRACVTAQSIQGLFEPRDSSYGAKYLDQASISILCRGLIENIAVLRYVGDLAIGEDEWKCRKYLIDLYDYHDRSTFLQLMRLDQDDGEDYSFLETRLKQNAYFKTLKPGKQTQLLQGKRMFITGRHEAMLALGWGDELTRGIYKYLSNQAHTLSMAFHRTELNKLYEQDSSYAEGVSAFSLEFGRKALGFGCLHMISLFPYIEAAFEPAVFSALKNEYAPPDANTGNVSR